MKSSSLSPDSLAQKLVFYGIGAGALSVAATAAQAAIVTTVVGQSGDTFYFTLQNTTAVSTTSSTGEQYEINGGSTKAKGNYTNSVSYELAAESKTGQLGPTEYFLNLGVGATVGSSLAFTSSGIFNNYYGGGVFPAGAKAGDWQAGNRGFLALEFSNPGTGQVDYGFADITFNGVTGTNDFTLNGFAYDTTGAAITTFAIPEPGSTTALLIFGGAAGAAALRRRRAANAVPA